MRSSISREARSAQPARGAEELRRVVDAPLDIVVDDHVLLLDREETLRRGVQRLDPLLEVDDVLDERDAQLGSPGSKSASTISPRRSLMASSR